MVIMQIHVERSHREIPETIGVVCFYHPPGIKFPFVGYTFLVTYAILLLYRNILPRIKLTKKNSKAVPFRVLFALLHPRNIYI